MKKEDDLKEELEYEEDIDEEENLEEDEEVEITEEDNEEEILEEVLADDADIEKDSVTGKRKRPQEFHDEDIFPLQSKLTCFINGYLVTLDETDIKILNKFKGEEREQYLKNIKATCNQKLIYKVANKLLRFENNKLIRIDPEELYAAGWHALAKAIKTYDYSKGWLFTTYAYKIIQNEMIQEIKRVKKKVVQRINGEKYESLAIHVSMDAPIRNDNKGNDIYVSDMISDKRDGPEKILEKEDMKTVIMQAFDEVLDPTEKYVMTYRYGLDRDIILTQKEIAEKLNQSQANISKIEKTCRLKLCIALKGILGENWEG